MKSRKEKSKIERDVLERDLRAWLKSVWSRGKNSVGLQWIEPAKGSSIGFPDVLIPVSPLLIPVELKVVTKEKTKGICSSDNLILKDTNIAYEGYNFSAKIRPAQKRFHLLMAREKIFSCYLTAIGNLDRFDVWLSSALFWRESKREIPGDFLVAQNQTTASNLSRDDFISLLNSFMKNVSNFE